MHDIRHPTQFFDRFEHTPRKENRPFVIVGEETSLSVAQREFTLKVVLVVDKIDLDTGRRDRRDLDNQLMVVIVDDQIHARKADHFVKLVPPLVDKSVTRHESADLITSFLHALRQSPAQCRHIIFSKIWRYLLTDI